MFPAMINRVCAMLALALAMPWESVCFADNEKPNVNRLDEHKSDGVIELRRTGDTCKFLLNMHQECKENE